MARRYDPATYQPEPVNLTIERLKGLLESLSVVLVAVVVALLMKAFVVQAFFIPSGSMEDTLVTGDKVLVNKLSYRFGDIHRGDIVVFDSPPAERAVNPDITHLIKRVIGLPGDVIYSREGKLFVNNVAQVEPYVKPGATTEIYDTIQGCPQPLTVTDTYACVVPTGQLFLMGDNREDSQDSRFFGPVSQNLVVGRAAVLIWPLSNLSGL